MAPTLPEDDVLLFWDVRPFRASCAFDVPCIMYPCIMMFHDVFYFGRQELWINSFPLLPASPVKDVTVFLPLLHALVGGVAERICTTWSRRLCQSASTWTRTARLYRWFIMNFHSHSPVRSTQNRTGQGRQVSPDFGGKPYSSPCQVGDQWWILVDVQRKMYW